MDFVEVHIVNPETEEFIESNILAEVTLDTGEVHLVAVDEKKVSYIYGATKLKGNKWIKDTKNIGGIFYSAPRRPLQARVDCYNKETKHTIRIIQPEENV